MNLHERLDSEDDDPILSLVNLIDVFLVIIAALLLAVGNNPINPLSSDKVTVIKNAGQANMEVILKDGAKVEKFKAGQGSGEGRGVKAGVAYRMADGSMVYVPEAGASAP
jgi:hypothetical protein